MAKGTEAREMDRFYTSVMHCREWCIISRDATNENPFIEYQCAKCGKTVLVMVKEGVTKPL